MNKIEPKKEAAIELVAELLSRHLEVGGVYTSRPDFYFQCEAEEPREYIAGFEIRVKTWWHWSDARVIFDGDNGELMAYSINRYADPPNCEEMTQKEAIATVTKAIQVPSDAVLKSFYHFEYAPQRKLARLEWERFHQELRVDGDYLFVSIHPKTHRIVEFARKWRTLRLT